MFELLWSLLGWQEKPSQKPSQTPSQKPSPTPPPATITSIRIPADGTPPHLLTLTTTPADSFLFHVPDLCQYWKTDKAWSYRDLQRMEIQEQPCKACDGVYYLFFSFALDDLPQITSVPGWIVDFSKWSR